MSEQRTPPQTPAQPADAKRQEGEPTVPDPEDLDREKVFEQRVGVQTKGGTGRVVQKRTREKEREKEEAAAAAKRGTRADEDGERPARTKGGSL